MSNLVSFNKLINFLRNFGENYELSDELRRMKNDVISDEILIYFLERRSEDRYWYEDNYEMVVSYLKNLVNPKELSVKMDENKIVTSIEFKPSVDLKVHTFLGIERIDIFRYSISPSRQPRDIFYDSTMGHILQVKNKFHLICKRNQFQVPMSTYKTNLEVGKHTPFNIAKDVKEIKFLFKELHSSNSMNTLSQGHRAGQIIYDNFRNKMVNTFNKEVEEYKEYINTNTLESLIKVERLTR